MTSGYPDFEGDKSAVFSKADWAALMGIDKDFSGIGTDKAFNASTLVTYTVPAGKKLYIVQASIGIFASAVANADNNQFGYLYLYNATTAANLAFVGVNGGGSLMFPKPIALTALQVFRLYGVSKANHDVDIYISASGWEE